MQNAPHLSSSKEHDWLTIEHVTSMVNAIIACFATLMGKNSQDVARLGSSRIEPLGRQRGRDLAISLSYSWCLLEQRVLLQGLVIHGHRFSIKLYVEMIDSCASRNTSSSFSSRISTSSVSTLLDTTFSSSLSKA